MLNQTLLYALLIGGGLVGGIAWREVVAVAEEVVQDQAVLDRQREAVLLRAEVERLQMENEALRGPGPLAPPDMPSLPDVPLDSLPMPASPEEDMFQDPVPVFVAVWGGVGSR